jgi:hypothetical protein
MITTIIIVGRRCGISFAIIFGDVGGVVVLLLLHYYYYYYYY